MRVLSVVGNRPQFVKSAPLSIALRERGIEEIAVHTGQHWDPELSQVFYDELGLPEPAYRLDARSREVGTMEPGVAAAIETERPELVLVFGDTNSTLAGARAAADARVPLAHVEAGLRSGDWSMPEEHARVEVDRLADLLLCPDERSAETLRGEGARGRVEVVGDVMGDATRLFSPFARAVDVGLRADQPYAVLTLHREGNLEPTRLRRLISELNGTGWTFVFPVHPGTRRALDEHGIRPAPSLHAIPPVGYLEMLSLVANASRVVTDSGGLQKEAYWLKVPCITLRPSTEWIDTVLVGANTLIDPDEPGGLGRALVDARFPADAPPLYGDGRSAERIAEAVASLGRA
jgi:UDP-GlcNAc3NAcA epimerase